METKLAIVKNGVVANIIVVDPNDTGTIAYFGGRLLPGGSPVAIGWLDDGVNFSNPVTLVQAQAAQLALMDSSYDNANQLPIAYLATTFQADNVSTVLLSQTITMLQATSTPSVTWWDTTNTGVTMTTAQLIGLGAAIFARGQTLFAHKQTQKAAIRAATTVAQVQAVIW